MFMRRIATFLLASAALFLLALVPLWSVPAGNARADSVQADNTVRILAFGDSLTAGYGLSEAEGFTTQLAQALTKMGRKVQVINGGVSGDTTTGGLARLDWSLADQPQVMLLELGGNDMLRGLPPETVHANLQQIIDKARAAKVTVLLIGMRAAPNLGADYQQQFDAVYPALAKADGLLFYPFMLDGAVGDPALMQSDGIHANAKGVAIIVQRILPSVLQALDQIQKPAG
jgi:acyl-CoA thioesterase-1